MEAGLRFIYHVGGPTSRMLQGRWKERLDQSTSKLREPHPCHVEYLHSMGVTASVAIPIVVQNQLWGLYILHAHDKVQVKPSMKLRIMLEMTGK